MGKYKQGKKKSVFKVAGAKSLKAKEKAKPVTGNFKKIKETIRKQIGELDKSFVYCEKDIRQKKKKTEEKVKPSSSKQENKSAKDFDKEKDKALEKLNKLQF